MESAARCGDVLSIGWVGRDAGAPAEQDDVPFVAITKTGYQIVENDGFEIDLDSYLSEILSDEVSYLLAEIVFDVGIEIELVDEEEREYKLKQQMRNNLLKRKNQKRMKQIFVEKKKKDELS